MNKKLSLLIFVLALVSCNQREEAQANTSLLYFDVKGYFAKETLRLQKQNPVVQKSVSINGTVENKTIRIKDWEAELAIFVDADINKTSWKGSFKTDRQNSSETYTSSDKKIPVKSLQIEKRNLKISKIQVIIANKNILYTSNDTLIYYPDSVYQIKKQQNIKLLNPKRYTITGKFKS